MKNQIRNQVLFCFQSSPDGISCEKTDLGRSGKIESRVAIWVSLSLHLLLGNKITTHLQHDIQEQAKRLYKASDFTHSVQQSHKTAAVRGTPAALPNTQFILPLSLLLFFFLFVYVLFVLMTD